MSSIVFGSPEARVVLRRDAVRRLGYDPDNTVAVGPPEVVKRPYHYLAASWDNCDGSFEVEEDNDAFAE